MSDLSCIANNEIKSKLQQKFALVPLSQNRIQVNCIAMVWPAYIQCTFGNIHFLDLSIYVDSDIAYEGSEIFQYVLIIQYI